MKSLACFIMGMVVVITLPITIPVVITTILVKEVIDRFYAFGQKCFDKVIESIKE